MSHYKHSKSGLFLVELLINLLLFCLLCAYGLMFFIKSNNITQDTTTLHQAVRITTSIASIYESGDGSYSALCQAYEHATLADNFLYIYFDEDFNPCDREHVIYYVSIEKLYTALNKIQIDFYDADGDVAHSITACQYTPSTLETIQEEQTP